MDISYWQVHDYVFINIFPFGERMLLVNRTHSVGLAESMVLHMKLKCCVFNKVFLVNDWCGIHRFTL